MSRRHSPGLHARLRDATQAAHRALDHHPVLAPLVRADLTRAQYGLALSALHGIQASVESAILDFMVRHPQAFNYVARRRASLLEDDLRDLGLTPGPALAIAPPQDVGEAVGMLYTIEGSSLGGQVIRRQVESLPGERLPVRFFSGYGDRTPALWAEFLAWSAVACPPERYEAAEAAAVALFSAIKRHLDGAMTERLEDAAVA
jgi:heme oxygenase